MMSVGMLLWLVLIPLVVWAVLRFTADQPGNGGRRETPEEILDRRFAQGELDLATYAEMRTRLGNPATRHARDAGN